MSGTIRNGPGSIYDIVCPYFLKSAAKYFRSLVTVAEEIDHMLVTSPSVGRSSFNIVVEQIRVPYTVVCTFIDTLGRSLLLVKKPCVDFT